MKLILSILNIFGLFVALAAVFVYVEIDFFTPYGFENAGDADLLRPSLLSAFSVLGIISKSLFDSLQSSTASANLGKSIQFALSLRNIIRAVIICPLVILGFYNTLDSISDSLIIYLLAYQNGFFFEAILHPVKPEAA